MKLWEQVKQNEETLITLQEENSKLQEETKELKETIRLMDYKVKREILQNYLKLNLEIFTKEEIITARKVLIRIPLGYFKNKDITYLVEDLKELEK